MVKKNGILGSMHDIFHNLEEQKQIVVLPNDSYVGAFRLTIYHFVLPNDEKFRALTLKCHFFKYSKLFPLQKVKCLVPKIPIGEKSFLCC